MHFICEMKIPSNASFLICSNNNNNFIHSQEELQYKCSISVWKGGSAVVITVRWVEMHYVNQCIKQQYWSKYERRIWFSSLVDMTFLNSINKGWLPSFHPRVCVCDFCVFLDWLTSILQLHPSEFWQLIIISIKMTSIPPPPPHTHTHTHTHVILLSLYMMK